MQVCGPRYSAAQLPRCLLTVALLMCATAGVNGEDSLPLPDFAAQFPAVSSSPAEEIEARMRRLEAELSALKTDRGVVHPEREFEVVSPVEEEAGVIQLSNWSSYQEAASPSADGQTSTTVANLGEDPDLPNRPPGFRDRLFLQRSEDDDSGFPTLDWSGFLQFDHGYVEQDAVNELTVGDISPETGLRRVRLRVDGNVRENSTYVIDLDFAASGHPSFRNVLVAFHELPVAQNVQMGYFKQSLGMQAMTRATDLRFMERTLPFAFDPFRQTGIGAFGNWADRRMSWSVSTFGFPTDSFGVTTGEALGTSWATRITALPVYEDEGANLVHVGGGYTYITPADETARFAIQPGFFVVDPGNPDASTSVPTFVDTGPIHTSTYHVMNAELAANFWVFSLHSEATFAVVNQIDGPTLNFSGAYASAGYVLTGEKYRYSRRHAIFPKITPDEDFSINGGIGAWELTAGWSYINLNDQNIQGGRLNNVILGLNWYVTPYGRFQINIIPGRLNDPEYGSSDATIIGMRAQVEY